MATVALNGAVQTDAESTTGWASGGLESELSYQATSSVGAKAGSGTTRFIHVGTARDFSVGGANEGDHIIVLLNSLTPGKLDTKANGGLGIVCGTSATVYGEWYVDGSDTKPPTTAFLPYIVDPASDFDAVTAGLTLTGNPAQLSAADAFGGRFDATSGIMGNFNNALVDQITIGKGLELTGTAGVLQDFVDADEGTVGNRYGFVTTRDGIVYCQGKLYLGTSAASLVFDDTDQVLVFQDATVAADFYEIIVDNASSDITMDGWVIKSAGASQAALTYTAGTLLIENGTIDSFRQLDLGSGVTIQNQKISNSGQVTQNGATLTNVQVTGSTVVTGAAVVLDNLVSVDELVITGSADDGLDLTAIAGTSIGLSNISVTGSAGFDVVVSNASDVTLTLSGTSSIGTATNIGAGNVSIVSGAVVTKITVVDTSLTPIENARVYVLTAAGGPLTAGTEIISGLTDVNGEIQDVRSFASDQPITGRVRKSSSSPFYKTGSITGTISNSSGFTVTVQMILDE